MPFTSTSTRQVRRMPLRTTVIAALFLCASVCSPPAFSLTVPAEAQSWKRQFLNANQQVWGLSSPAWLAAQLGQESGWRDGLKSSAGALGLCQFIPSTAAGIEQQFAGLAALGRYSPKWCFYAQAYLMRDLYNTYRKDRDQCNGMKMAGSAYNGGGVMLRRELSLCAADYPNCDNRLWDENVGTKNARATWAYKENRSYVFRITQREPLYAASGWGIRFCPD